MINLTSENGRLKRTMGRSEDWARNAGGKTVRLIVDHTWTTAVAVIGAGETVRTVDLLIRSPRWWQLASRLTQARPSPSSLGPGCGDRTDVASMPITQDALTGAGEARARRMAPARVARSGGRDDRGDVAVGADHPRLTGRRAEQGAQAPIGREGAQGDRPHRHRGEPRGERLTSAAATSSVTSTQEAIAGDGTAGVRPRVLWIGDGSVRHDDPWQRWEPWPRAGRPGTAGPGSWVVRGSRRTRTARTSDPSRPGPRGGIAAGALEHVEAVGAFLLGLGHEEPHRASR